MHMSMSLRYEPFLEPMHLSVIDQVRCRANMAHIRQSRPDSGLGFQAKVLKTFRDVPYLIGRGRGARRASNASAKSTRSFIFTTLETTQRQIDGFLSQLPFNRYLKEVASVGDDLSLGCL